MRLSRGDATLQQKTCPYDTFKTRQNRMNSVAESSLIDQCLKGNRLAQRRLYGQYCDAMYNVCYRMLGNTAEAEDVLQEAFVDIFRKLDTFRGDSTLGAWIKRIVINHCLNELKRRKVQFQELEENYSLIADEEQDSGEEVELEVGKVKQAIMQLPDGYRQVLTMYLIEGYDHAEIASILGIQETGSKSQFSRAKARLRELLSK